MIPVDDVAAESVYRKVAEVICLRLAPPPPPPIVSCGLRIRWLGDGGSGFKLGEIVRDGLLWSTKDACVHAWKCWWHGAQASLPACREPREPVPALVNADNRIVGLISEDALV